MWVYALELLLGIPGEHAPPLRRNLPFLRCLAPCFWVFFSAFVLCISFVSLVQTVFVLYKFY